MKKILPYTLLIINIILLFGCEKEIDFNGKTPSPKIVVNSIVNARSDTNRIKISESVFDYSDQQPDIIENPDIRLNINGKENNQIWMDTIIGVHTYYKFVSALNTGDKIEFSIHTDKHGTVKGHDQVPDITEIKNIATSWFKKEGISYLRMYITLKDKAHERNFYRIVVKSQSNLLHPSQQPPLNYWDLHDVFIDDEILFHNPTETEEADKVPNYYRIFSDELFQGEEYTLNIYIRFDNFAKNPESNYVRQYVKAEIHTLSEKLYQNLNSQELASGMATGDIFSEPVKIYTNMQGGYGILGVYNVTEKEKTVAEKGE
ncbi:MAG: DUF4249 domain-containing protein [Tannerella sp.]|jgi:hypothetical protein|nr:DUF4249 domain-containing protein [Tannerella sp.]